MSEEQESLLGGQDPTDDRTFFERTHEFANNMRKVSREKSQEVWRNSLRGLQSSPWFLYNGVKFAFTHGWVWKSLIVPFLTFAAVSVAIFVILLLFTWKLQVEFIDRIWADDDDVVAELYAFYLVLQETRFLVNVLFMVILDTVRRKIYDQIFQNEAPEINYEPLSDVPTKDRLIITGYSLAVTITLDFVTSPLLTVPIGGKILIALAKGWALAWMYQSAFLASKGLSFIDQLRWVGRRFVAYELFGAVAVLLLYIPVLSWVFYWTNLCGAALWALSMSRVAHRYVQQIQRIASQNEDEITDKEALLHAPADDLKVKPLMFKSIHPADRKESV